MISRPERAYVIEYKDGDTFPEHNGHAFCGTTDFAEVMCPNCKLRLTRFLSIDLSDVRLQYVGPLQRLELLYCFRCNVANSNFGDGQLYSGQIHQIPTTQPLITSVPTDDSQAGTYLLLAPFYYQTTNRSISILQYCLGFGGQNEPYDDYPQSFPLSRVRLDALSDEEQAFIRMMNQPDTSIEVIEANPYRARLAMPVHQIGGEPLMIQGQVNLSMSCPICNLTMPFLASMANDCLDERGFTGEDNEYTQTVFHLCHNCSVVGVYNQAA
jgi:hypothetical protein